MIKERFPLKPGSFGSNLEYHRGPVPPYPLPFLSLEEVRLKVSKQRVKGYLHIHLQLTQVLKIWHVFVIKSLKAVNLILLMVPPNPAVLSSCHCLLDSRGTAGVRVMALSCRGRQILTLSVVLAVPLANAVKPCQREHYTRNKMFSPDEELQILQM